MQLELVSHPLCPYVHRSAIMLREKAVPFGIRYVEDLKNKPEWFVALSPRGKVPLLVVDGTVLFESAIINEYLDETNPPAWLPADPLEKARQRGWVEVATDLFAQQYTYAYGATAESSAEGLRNAQAIFERLERELRGEFFAGPSIGLVDVAFAPAFHRFAVLACRTGADVYARYPKVRAWAARIVARPSVTASVLPDFEERYVSGLRARGSALLAAGAPAAPPSAVSGRAHRA